MTFIVKLSLQLVQTMISHSILLALDCHLGEDPGLEDVYPCQNPRLNDFKSRKPLKTSHSTSERK